MATIEDLTSDTRSFNAEAPVEFGWSRKRRQNNQPTAASVGSGAVQQQQQLPPQPVGQGQRQESGAVVDDNSANMMIPDTGAIPSAFHEQSPGVGVGMAVVQGDGSVVPSFVNVGNGASPQAVDVNGGDIGANANTDAIFENLTRMILSPPVDETLAQADDRLLHRLKLWRPTKVDCWGLLEELENDVDISILYKHARAPSVKEQLLEISLRSFGTDTTLAVILFIRDTSETTAFARLLQKYPVALLNYARYLDHSGQLRRLLNLLQLFNAKLAEGKLILREAYKQMNPRGRVANMRYCADFFAQMHRAQSNQGYDYWFELCQQQIALLERQILIEEFDAKIAESGQEYLYKKFPPKSIVFAPLHDTLFYNEFYHSTAGPTKLSSPINLAKSFGMSEKKALWTALRARAKVGDWQYLQQITEKRGLFSVKPKSKIGFEPFVEVCHAYKAPKEVLNHFVMCISNTAHRIEVAWQYECYDALIDTYISKKDFDGMVHLLGFMEGDIAAGYLYGKYRGRIISALNDPQMKWNKSKQGYVWHPNA